MCRLEKDNIEVAHKFALEHLALKQNSSLYSNNILNYPDLVHSVKVSSYTIIEESDKNSEIVILLKEGNRSGVLQISTKFKIDDSFILQNVKGFWKSKISVVTHGDDDGEEFYEFICVDPFYLKYLQ